MFIVICDSGYAFIDTAMGQLIDVRQLSKLFMLEEMCILMYFWEIVFLYMYNFFLLKVSHFEQSSHITVEWRKKTEKMQILFLRFSNLYSGVNLRGYFDLTFVGFFYRSN